MDVEHRAHPGHAGIHRARLATGRGYSADRNLADLVQHAAEFEQRVAFAYTVLRPDADDVIGCLYLNPGPRPGAVDVRSWVRTDVAPLDGVLRQEVRDWLAQAWPFDEVEYAG